MASLLLVFFFLLQFALFCTCVCAKCYRNNVCSLFDFKTTFKNSHHHPGSIGSDNAVALFSLFPNERYCNIYVFFVWFSPEIISTDALHTFFNEVMKWDTSYRYVVFFSSAIRILWESDEKNEYTQSKAEKKTWKTKWFERTKIDKKKEHQHQIIIAVEQEARSKKSYQLCLPNDIYLI